MSSLGQKKESIVMLLLQLMQNWQLKGQECEMILCISNSQGTKDLKNFK
jgi:hypothetical protein